MKIQLDPSVIQICPASLRGTRARGYGRQRIHAPDAGLLYRSNLFVDVTHSVNEGARQYAVVYDNRHSDHHRGDYHPFCGICAILFLPKPLEQRFHPLAPQVS